MRVLGYLAGGVTAAFCALLGDVAVVAPVIVVLASQCAVRHDHLYAGRRDG